MLDIHNENSSLKNNISFEKSVYPSVCVPSNLLTKRSWYFHSTNLTWQVCFINLMVKFSWLYKRQDRGRREGGLTGFSKHFKTQFFKRYWKILLRAYSNRSRISPFFSFSKYLNKCSHKRRPKFWQKWAVAGRMNEQRAKFFCQIFTNSW